MPVDPDESIAPRQPRLNLGLLQTLGTIVLVVFALQAARVVIIPVALAVLFVFILSPLVRLLERQGLGRTPSVLLTLLTSGLVLAVVGYVIGGQITSLARDLTQNQYRTQIQKKIESLRAGSGGPFSQLMEMLNELAAGDGAGKNSKKPAGPNPPTGEGETPESTPEQQASAEAAAIAAAKVPLKVEQQGNELFDQKPAGGKEQIVVEKADKSSLGSIAESAAPVLEPLANVGLVAILVMFMLFNREDLRNRIIGLVGRNRVTGTTRVLSDAAERVSKLLLFQLIVNATFGLILAIGLYIIGVPYALLWGFLSAILRFIPYVGTWISALFPFAISFATSDGWAQPITVFAFFAILDIITGQVVEPLLFGHQTGVAPIALVIAAAFWLWLWGPIGLLLSTPITVCLAVIGAHVPKLRPLALLLGDEPALSPHIALYQRLLAKDRQESKALLTPADPKAANAQLGVYDTSALPMLLQARRDREEGDITAEEEVAIFDLVDGLVADTLKLKDPHTDDEKRVYTDRQAEVALMPVAIGTPAHHRAEELALDMLAAGLPDAGRRMAVLSSRQLPLEVEQAIESQKAVAAVIGILPPGGVPQAIYLISRLRKKFPDLVIVAAYFGRTRSFDKLLVRLRKAGATYVTTSLAQTADTLRNVGESPATGKPELAAV